MWSVEIRDEDYVEESPRVFTFGDSCCARAFVKGVEMVNDSALHVGEIEEVPNA